MSVPTEQTPETVQPVQAAVTPAAPAYPNASLYVGDLRQDITEPDIYAAFKECGPIASIKVVRSKDGVSLRYAFVNYESQEMAEKVMTTLNGIRLKKKPCRIMMKCRDPSLRKNPAANLFVKSLDPKVDLVKLQDVFSTFGPIKSTKVATDDEGVSYCFGFVQFEKAEDAQKALKASQDEKEGQVLKALGEKVFVAPFIPRSQRPTTANEHFTNLYVKNFGKGVTSEGLRKLFEQYGEITSAVVMENNEHVSRGFGFVNFKEHNDAVEAQKALDRKIYKWKDGAVVGEVAADAKPEEEEEGVEVKSLYVARAQKKSERMHMLAAQHLLKDNSEGKTNVFVRNIADVVNKEQLEKFFSPYGTIKSCVVMMDEHGGSRGFGFVDFATPEEAQNAIQKTMNQLFYGKPLYVALAQPKAVRRQMLENQFRAFNTIAMFPGMYQMNPVRPQFPMNFAFSGMSPYPVPMQRGPMQPRPFANRQQQRNRAGQMNRRMTNKQMPQHQAQQVQAVPAAAAAPAVPLEVAPQQQQQPVGDKKQELGEQIYLHLQKMFPEDEARWGKLTGMIIESIDVPVLERLVSDAPALEAKIREADEFYTAHLQKQGGAAEQH